MDGPRGLRESALALTSATTTRSIDAATAPARYVLESMRGALHEGRMLLEREPQRLAAWAFEFARGRMRATKVQNQGHQRTRGSFRTVFIDLGTPVEYP